MIHFYHSFEIILRMFSKTKLDLSLSVWVSPVEAQVSSGLSQGQGLWLQQTWEARHVCPTIEPPKRQPINWRTIIPKKFSHCSKSSRAHNKFPNLGIWPKDLRIPREFDIEAQWDLITELLQDWGNRFLESTNKTLCAPGETRKEQWPHKKLSQTVLLVSTSLHWRHQSTVAFHGDMGREYNSRSISPLEGGHHYPYHNLATCQTTGREHSPTHQQKIGLDLLIMALNIKERLRFSHSQSFPSGNFHKPLVFIHQRASEGIRGFPSKWKPQLQKTKQTDHLDHSLV